jgi:ribosomal protein S18 acetylase RimI-like enzyme
LGAAGDFSRFAFQALPVCGNDGLWLTSHLAEQDEVFEQAWTIYAEAFSGHEGRARREQSRVTRHPHYRFSAIMHEDSVVGVLAWWELPGFCFVEHFAISSAQRSGGFGRRAMALLQAHVAGPILMDVDPFGTDYLAARRVAFYQRLGFHYCGTPVMLPAYEGKIAAPSNLMAWPLALDAAGRERALEAIEREIYGQRAAVPYPSAV